MKIMPEMIVKIIECSASKLLTYKKGNFFVFEHNNAKYIAKRFVY